MQFEISLIIGIGFAFLIAIFSLFFHTPIILMASLLLIFLFLYQAKIRIEQFKEAVTHLIFSWAYPKDIVSFERESEMHLTLHYQNPLQLKIPQLFFRLESSHEFLSNHTMISLDANCKGTITIPIFIEHISTMAIWGITLYFQHPWLNGKLKTFYHLPLKISVIPKIHHSFLTEKEIRVQQPNQKKSRSLQDHDELKELREYQQGDPFSRIVWKSFAKNQKLIVKSYESIDESKIAYFIDTNEDMRAPIFGIQPIDFAIEDFYTTLQYLLKRKGLMKIYVGCFSAEKEEHIECRSLTQSLKILSQFQYRYSKSASDCDISIIEEKIAFYAQHVAQEQLFQEEIFQIKSDQMTADLVDRKRLLGFLENHGYTIQHIQEIKQKSKIQYALADTPYEELLRLYCFNHGIYLPFSIGDYQQSKIKAIIELIEWAIVQNLKMIVFYTNISIYSDELMKQFLKAKRKKIKVVLLQFGKLPASYLIKNHVFEHKIIKLFDAKSPL